MDMEMPRPVAVILVGMEDERNRGVKEGSWLSFFLHKLSPSPRKGDFDKVGECLIHTTRAGIPLKGNPLMSQLSNGNVTDGAQEDPPETKTSLKTLHLDEMLQPAVSPAQEIEVHAGLRRRPLLKVVGTQLLGDPEHHGPFILKGSAS